MSSPSQWNAGPWNSFLWDQVAGQTAAGQQQSPAPFTPILSGQIIPLTNAPYQTLRVTLAIDGGTLTLNLVVSYNEVGQFWCMAIYDQSGNALFSDVPLITGYWPGANILGQYAYAGIGSAYVISSSGGVGDWPGVNGWGNGWQLLWGDTPVVG